MCVNEWEKYCMYPCNVGELGTAADHAYLIVGVLKKKRHYIKNNQNKNVALGPKMNFILSEDNDKSSHVKPDSLMCILYVPSTSWFYFPQIAAKCKLIQAFMIANLERMNSELVPLQPLPSADLCITRSMGTPSNGGFLSSFTDVFQIEVESTLFPVNKCTEIKAYHFPDDKIFLTPDLYAWHKPGNYPDPAKNAEDAQHLYVNKLRNSKTNRDGCCAYVPGSYYHNIQKCFPDAYILDTSSFHEGNHNYCALSQMTRI